MPDDTGADIPGTLLGELPSLSPVVERIRSVISSARSSARDVVTALKLDPVIAGKVLRLANSASVGIPRTVSSLQNAVVLLGQKRILSLVTVSEALGVFKKRSGAFPLSVQNFWRHSITSAMVAESIAHHLSQRECLEAEEVFSAAILHDIGKLALCWRFPEQMKEHLLHCLNAQEPFFVSEDPRKSHAEIGAFLLDRWNFPQDLTQAIRAHHCPSQEGVPDVLASIVHLSDVAAHILGFQTCEGEVFPPFDAGAVGRIELFPERIRVIAEEVLRDQQRIENAFNVMN